MPPRRWPWRARDVLHEALQRLGDRRVGAERVLAMSRHLQRQQLASEFGATDVVAQRGEEGVGRVRDLTDGVGADAVLASS